MIQKADVTPAMCAEVLEYDPETGKLKWRMRSADSAAFNARYGGREAFTATHSERYKVGQLHGHLFRAHRIIWAMVHGYWPKQVDHINGDRADNRLCNLREVDNQQNQRNVRLTRNNTSGVCGVHWNRRANRWHARIGIDRRQISLGLFKDKNEAIQARRAAEAQYGFSEIHGT